VTATARAAVDAIVDRLAPLPEDAPYDDVEAVLRAYAAELGCADRTRCRMDTPR
jgi:hypothetical protein